MNDYNFNIKLGNPQISQAPQLQKTQENMTSLPKNTEKQVALKTDLSADNI